MISIITLAIVFTLIAVRQIGLFRLQIWQVMSLGAVVILVTGQISPINAFRAINIDIILFLFGMFIIGQALEDSGYLYRLSYRIFAKARSLNILLLMIFFLAGILSAILMNDTLAIIGTPVMIQIARNTGINTKILLISLAFSITIGSVMSPIGNPQNLLVAVYGDLSSPFLTFLRYLAIPTLFNIILTCILIRLFYRDHTKMQPFMVDPVINLDRRLTLLCKTSLLIIITLIIVKIILVLSGVDIDFRLTYIALAGALPIILFSNRRLDIIRRIDWFTIIFFVALFILIESVWESGFLQSIMSEWQVDYLSTGVILTVSVILSQFISNVPMVILYMPVITKLGASVPALMALAAGSTIAGNLSILGAASNVIIIQNAEKKGGETINFWEFMKIGLPVTFVNILVYWGFFLIS